MCPWRAFPKYYIVCVFLGRALPMCYVSPEQVFSKSISVIVCFLDEGLSYIIYISQIRILPGDYYSWWMNKSRVSSYDYTVPLTDGMMTSVQYYSWHARLFICTNDMCLHFHGWDIHVQAYITGMLSKKKIFQTPWYCYAHGDNIWLHISCSFTIFTYF